jgi:hypothetical protein
MLRPICILLLIIVSACSFAAGYFLYGSFRAGVFSESFSPTGFLFGFALSLCFQLLPAGVVVLGVVGWNYWMNHLRLECRTRRGLCWACAYARPITGVCPECGDAGEITRSTAGKRFLLVALCLWPLGNLIAAGLADWRLTREDVRFARDAELLHQTSTAVLRRIRPSPWQGYSLNKSPDRDVWVND